MRIAGFDIATRTGITIVTPTFVRASSWSAHAKRPANLGPTEIIPEYEAEIAEEFRDFARVTLVAEGIEYVAYEEPRTRDYERTKRVADKDSKWFGQTVKERSSNNLAMIRAVGLCTVLCGVCRRLEIPTVSVPGDEWRKALLGFSRAPKAISGDAARRKYLKEAVRKQCELMGIVVPNNDASDSCGVAFWLQGYLKMDRLRLAGELALKGAA